MNTHFASLPRFTFSHQTHHHYHHHHNKQRRFDPHTGQLLTTNTPPSHHHRHHHHQQQSQPQSKANHVFPTVTNVNHMCQQLIIPLTLLGPHIRIAGEAKIICQCRILAQKIQQAWSLLVHSLYTLHVPLVPSFQQQQQPYLNNNNGSGSGSGGSGGASSSVLTQEQLFFQYSCSILIQMSQQQQQQPLSCTSNPPHHHHHSQSVPLSPLLSSPSSTTTTTIRDNVNTNEQTLEASPPPPPHNEMPSDEWEALLDLSALNPLLTTVQTEHELSVRRLLFKCSHWLQQLSQLRDQLRNFADLNASLANDFELQGGDRLAKQKRILSNVESALVARIDYLLNGCTSSDRNKNENLLFQSWDELFEIALDDNTSNSNNKDRNSGNDQLNIDKEKNDNEHDANVEELNEGREDDDTPRVEKVMNNGDVVATDVNNKSIDFDDHDEDDNVTDGNHGRETDAITDPNTNQSISPIDYVNGGSDNASVLSSDEVRAANEICVRDDLTFTHDSFIDGFNTQNTNEYNRKRKIAEVNNNIARRTTHDEDFDELMDCHSDGDDQVEDELSTQVHKQQRLQQ